MLLYSSDKSQILTVNNFTTDNSTSLTFIGYGYVNPENPSGEILNQNLLYLLQNFSSGNAPINPLIGQTWFNDSTNIFNVYNNSGWDGLISESNISSTQYVNTNIETQSDILSDNFANLSFLNSQNYEREINLNYITLSQIYGYATTSYLNTSITNFLNNFVLTSSLSSTFVTSSQLSGYNYLNQNTLTSLNLATENQLSNLLTQNQTITFSGDITGSGTNSINSNLSTITSAGTYENIAVNVKGLIVSNVGLNETIISNALGFTPLGLSNISDSILTNSGYQKLPSGLIIQWIQSNVDPADNTETTQTLPWALAFPNSFLGATVSTNIQTSSSNADLWYQISESQTNSSQVVINRHNDSSSNNTTTSAFIIGFGY